MRSKAVGLAAGAGLVAIVAGIAVAARTPQIRVGLERMIAAAQTLPAQHWGTFVVLQVAVAAFGFLPASLMAVTAGAAYGMALGTLISIAGTMAGGWIAFLLSRSVLRPWIARLLGRYAASARFDAAIATEGWRFVCLMRLSPVMPFAATSYGLGLTRISQKAYLLGTLASLPALVGYVALGAFGRAGLAWSHGAAQPLHWLLPAIGLVMVLVAVARLRRLARSGA